MNHFNHDIEKAVIGRIIFDDAFLNVCDILEPKHFHAKEHADVYAAYHGLFMKHSSPDMHDVIKAVKIRVGNDVTTFLSVCQELAKNAWNTPEKAEMIRELWLRRQLKELGQQLDVSPNQANDLLDIATNAVLELKGVKDKNATVTAAALIEEDIERLKIAIQYSRSGEALPDAMYTGFIEIDKALGGIMTKELGIVAGRPGMGKTTEIINWMKKLCRDGVPIYFLSLDMPSQKVIRSMACNMADVDHSKLRDGTASDAEMERIYKAYAEIAGFNLQLNEVSYELEDIYMAVKRWRIQNPTGPVVVFIDYVQKVFTTKISLNNTTANQTYVANTLNRMSKDLDIAVVGLSQLGRAVESRGGDMRPRLSDLRESGAWEQEAQWVAMMYRPEYYGFETDEEGNSTKGLAEVAFLKNRNGEINKVCKQLFIGKYGQFRDWSGSEHKGFTPMSQFTSNPAIDFKTSIMSESDVNF